MGRSLPGSGDQLSGFPKDRGPNRAAHSSFRREVPPKIFVSRMLGGNVWMWVVLNSRGGEGTGGIGLV